MYQLVEGDFDAFFRTPFDCYEQDSRYVSLHRSDLRRLLDTRANPLFASRSDLTHFTVQDNRRCLGRIVAHVHRRSNELHGLKRSYFGFFDCIDDQRVAGLLLEAAEGFGRQLGCEEIAGNFNLTAVQPCGVVTEGFDHGPYTDQIYNPPHIPHLLRAAGYEATFPMSTFEVDVSSIDAADGAGIKASGLLRDPSLSWRQLRPAYFARQMSDILHVLNDGFARNPMFTPLTPQEFLFQAEPLKWIIDDRITPLVYCGNEPVGVILCIPDLNPLLRATRSRFGWNAPYHYARHWLNRRRAVIVFYSVVSAFHNHGLNSLNLQLLGQALRKAGYTQLGVTWIGEQNAASLRQMQKIGARRMHHLHLFHKRLTSG